MLVSQAKLAEHRVSEYHPFMRASLAPFCMATIGLLLASAGCTGNPNTQVTSAQAGSGAATAAATAPGTDVLEPSAAFLAKRSPTSLLSDRLTLRMPVGAKSQARSHSIMAADTPNEEETRVLLDAGDERFVLMAYELFATPGQDPERAVRTDMNSEMGDLKPTLAPLRLSDSNTQAWAVVPGVADRERVAIPVLAVYVVHPDRFMQLLTFYVNPAAAKDPKGCSGLASAAGATDLPDPSAPLPRCTAFAQAIASTLHAGARRMDVSGGERPLGEFVAKVPPGASITAQEGPDFFVYRVRLPVELGGKQPTLGIYVGGHPSYQYRQNDAQVQPTEKQAPAFGKTVAWQVWPMSPERVMAEVIVPHPKPNEGFVHLFAGAGDEKALAPVLELAASLRVR